MYCMIDFQESVEGMIPQSTHEEMVVFGSVFLLVLLLSLRWRSYVRNSNGQQSFFLHRESECPYCY